MITMKMKEVTIQGTPYERGCAYGQQCREEIGVSIRVCGALFQELQGISWEKARKLSEFYLEKTREFAPDYVKEMQGIADGANTDLLDIAALNARTEIMFAQLKDAQECTTLSLIPPATADGRVIAAQNWDFYGQLRDSLVIVHIHQEDKPNFVTVSEAGMIGGIGMNDRGIGVLLNALTTDTSCHGIPLRTRMRAMLDACYPAAIVVVLYYVICPKLGSLRLLSGARFAMIAAAVVGFIDVLNSYNSLLNINNVQFTNFYHWLPLSAYHLTWIPVSAVCFLLGALLCRPKTK